MKEILEEIGKVLDEEDRACDEALSIAQEETQALVRINAESVERLGRRQQALAVRMGWLATRRLRLQDDLRKSLNLPEDRVVLSVLAGYLPDPYRVTLSNRSETLRRKYRDLARASATHKFLIEEYLGGTQEFLTLLAGGDQEGTYSPRGRQPLKPYLPVAFDGLV